MKKKLLQKVLELMNQNFKEKEVKFEIKISRKTNKILIFKIKVQAQTSADYYQLIKQKGTANKTPFSAKKMSITKVELKTCHQTGQGVTCV